LHQLNPSACSSSTCFLGFGIKTAFIWDESLASFRFANEHPLNPRRLELTLSLIRGLHLLDGDSVVQVAPRSATDDEILSVHTRDYVEAVKRALPNPRYGLGTDDVPVQPGMHEAAAHIVGATLVAAQHVMSGKVKHAFNMAGGLHHAQRNQASGFCIYNDLAVAIRWMQQQYNARVMYIDYDAHHGDGVQWIFYDDPGVLKVSYHESGAFLFPGTGFIDEDGEGAAHGYSVNIPLEPHTSNASLLRAFDELVPELAAAFKPDVIVLQNGCDGHQLDPLTHLAYTTRAYEQVVQRVCAIADQYCEGRVVATGGGGYAVYDVVPRAWTLVWAALRGINVADAIPPEWIDMVEREVGRPVAHTLRDAEQSSTEAFTNNDRTVRAVRNKILPLLTGWGLHY
jgi:acetoin utilization protein AcuC